MQRVDLERIFAGVGEGVKFVGSNVKKVVIGLAVIAAAVIGIVLLKRKKK